MKDLTPKRYLFAFKHHRNLPDGSFASIFTPPMLLPPSRIQRRTHIVRLLKRHRGRYTSTVKKEQIINVVNPDMKPLIHHGKKAR